MLLVSTVKVNIIVYNQLSVWSYPFATQSHGTGQYWVNPFPYIHAYIHTYIEESKRHIGVQRTSSNNSAGATVKANITKARVALYSLMSSGLHGKRGLNPCTSIKLRQIYVLPILTYGLELFTLNQKLNTELENFQTRTFRQLLSLPDSTPSSAV